jgi:hypothetical protein
VCLKATEVVIPEGEASSSSEDDDDEDDDDDDDEGDDDATEVGEDEVKAVLEARRKRDELEELEDEEAETLAALAAVKLGIIEGALSVSELAGHRGLADTDISFRWWTMPPLLRPQRATTRLNQKSRTRPRQSTTRTRRTHLRSLVLSATRRHRPKSSCVHHARARRSRCSLRAPVRDAAFPRVRR